MVLSTAFSQMFGIDYPIVSAPMDLIAGGELAAAVSGAGGLGLIGGGYGDRDWLARQFDLAAGAPVGCGFITWSLARQPQLLDLALQYEPVAVMLSFGDPAVFADAIKSAGTRLVCQIKTGPRPSEPCRSAPMCWWLRAPRPVGTATVHVPP